MRVVSLLSASLPIRTFLLNIGEAKEQALVSKSFSLLELAGSLELRRL